MMGQSLYDNQLELAGERERLIITLRSIGDGVIATDIDDRVTLLNKVAEKLTGWNNDQAIGLPLERGAKKFIRKPYSLTELGSRITEMLNTSRGKYGLKTNSIFLDPKISQYLFFLSKLSRSNKI